MFNKEIIKNDSVAFLDPGNVYVDIKIVIISVVEAEILPIYLYFIMAVMK